MYICRATEKLPPGSSENHLFLPGEASLRCLKNRTGFWRAAVEREVRTELMGVQSLHDLPVSVFLSCRQ